MTDLDKALLERCHYEQRGPQTCVAACVCIIKTWQGHDVDETRLIAEWGGGSGPFNLELDAASALNTKLEVLEWDSRIDRTYLFSKLEKRWLIVSLYGKWGPDQHAVVLVGIEHSYEHFFYLDPAHSFADQPFVMLVDEFLCLWTGEVVIPRDGRPSP